MKSWLNMHDIKDKGTIKKRKMQVQDNTDPENSDLKLDLMGCVRQHIAALSIQSEKTEALLCSARARLQRGDPPAGNAPTVHDLEGLNIWRSWHLNRLEYTLRGLDNDIIELNSAVALYDDLEDLFSEMSVDDSDFGRLATIFEQFRDIYHDIIPVEADIPPTISQSSTSSKEYGPQRLPEVRGFISPQDPQIAILLKAVLDARVPESTLMGLVGSDPRHVIDWLQQILDLPSSDGELVLLNLSIDQNDRRQTHGRLRRILLKLSLHHNLLPSALTLPNVVCSTSESIGFGGFADVFCGTHQGRRVALKRLRVFLMSDPSKRQELRRAFYRESIIWRFLSHRHLLPFLGIDNKIFREAFCMVSPWMEHGNIRHAIDSMKESMDNAPTVLFNRVNRWIREIALGLAYLHEECIVHGDLRAANILIDSDWTVKLADFGLSLFADGTSNHYASARGGSMRWLAPEIIDPEAFGVESSRSTYASDVYSFACTCMELYTSEAPFSGLSEATVINRIHAQGLYQELEGHQAFV
ncbi:kinase-like domain-containing protein [Cristinia sonorae]|uniref:Kinase-like domain-containing protein n=1 Tax=Cristinia sonorae TaxID=1940300 RepID=A0A8K0UQ48_9AGAR|nr:kinase-like domain-containing protein [Cristinia sonorae]